MKKEKSCGAIIFNDNKVLIIKSKKGYYGFPKGHMEPGESEVETAIREVKEETNLNIEINDTKRYSIAYIIKEDIEKEVVYFIGIAKTFDINPQIEEVSEIMWVNVDEVETLLQFDNIKELWRGVLKLYRNGENFMGKRVLTGIKPTGELTIGNYIGAIKPLLEMQKEYDDIFLFVADLHAITVAQDPNTLKTRIKEFIALYLACGIDPNKVTIYIQSENEYIPAISWVLECNTYYGEASRMIQFKEKSKGKENFTLGLLTYPMLMAADILYCDSDYVPVGIDQKQHVEIARDIAERFNNKYGETFKLPIPIIKKEGMKIKDLKDPSKKMSKSEENPNGVILMFDSKETIIKKIMGATTDNEVLVKFDEDNKPGISNLINIASIMSNKDIKKIEDMFVGKNYGEFKKYVAEITSSRIVDIQSKYNDLINSKYLNEILDKGINKSRNLAKEKYELIKQKLGLYFER